MQHPFKALFDSTKHFHLRFRGGELLTPKQAVQPICEEAQEVIHALEYESCQNLSLEIADCIVTLFGAALARGVTYENIEQALVVVAAKNNAKSWKTHHIREDGKIARREPK